MLRGYLTAFACLLIGGAMGWFLPHGKMDGKVKSDTVTLWDTIHDSVPKLVYQEIPKYIKEKPIEWHDTVRLQDTLYITKEGDVVVPISRKVYTDDSTYRAVVSGYKANLDEMDVYRKNTVVTNTITKTKRWNIGVMGGLGYGVTSKTPDVFLGVGLVYNITP